MEVDKTGAAFDPTIHYMKDGKGVLTKAGIWRRRSGIPKQATDPEKEELRARLARLEAAYAERPPGPPVLSSVEIARLTAAIEELGRLHPGASAAPLPPPGPRPAAVPYRGLVRAKVDCATDCLHKAGDVFEVSTAALWTDDPFEPVTVAGQNEDGTPRVILNPDAPAPIDYRFRSRVDEATANLSARAV